MLFTFALCQFITHCRYSEIRTRLYTLKRRVYKRVYSEIRTRLYSEIRTRLYTLKRRVYKRVRISLYRQWVMN